MPEPEKVEEGDEYFHVRFNDPDKYEAITTPDWADNVSDSVSEGSEVRMGKKKGSDDWEIQSVLIRKNAGREKAVEQAEKIAEKIRS